MGLTHQEVFATVIQAVFAVVIFGNVFRKAGYSRWYSCLLAIPFANLLVIIWFSFTDWPIEQQVRRLEFEATRVTHTTGR